MLTIRINNNKKYFFLGIVSIMLSILVLIESSFSNGHFILLDSFIIFLLSKKTLYIKYYKSVFFIILVIYLIPIVYTIGDALLLHLFNFEKFNIDNLIVLNEESYEYKSAKILSYDFNMISAFLSVLTLYYWRKNLFLFILFFSLLLLTLSRGAWFCLIITFILFIVLRDVKLKIILFIFFLLNIFLLTYSGPNEGLILKKITILSGLENLSSSNFYNILFGDKSNSFELIGAAYSVNAVNGHTLLGVVGASGLATVMPQLILMYVFFAQSVTFKKMISFLIFYSGLSVLAFHFCLPFLFACALRGGGDSKNVELS